MLSQFSDCSLVCFVAYIKNEDLYFRMDFFFEYFFPFSRLNASGDWCGAAARHQAPPPLNLNPVPTLNFEDSDDDEANLQIT